MQCSPLSLVKQRICVGAPLPFNIRDHDQTLLLAKGQMVETTAQLEALFDRGALVDVAELLSASDRVRLARPEDLPGLWTTCLERINTTLQAPQHSGFRDALDASSAPVLALVARDPDLAIFQVLRQQGNQHLQYGVNHSTHAAITAWLVARRLGWAADEAQTAFKAALTMNLSMLELQGVLAQQKTPPTPAQRALIMAHPGHSQHLLEQAGVANRDWLTAVAQHHEAHDGSGYPLGLREPSDIAALVRRADIYTAKLSPRAHRDAVAADKAGRMMFMQEPGHPMVAALVKEFGVYPPGCFVKLQSGETGLVVKRGATVMTPIVAVLSTPYGTPLRTPERRDTSQKAYAVHAVLAGNADVVRLPPQQLLAVLAA